MYFLLSGCQNPDVLRIVLLATKILDIVCIIIPIGLIIFLIIDLVKMMLSADQKQNKTLKTIINRIVFSVLIFFVPTIVTVIMTLLSNSGVDIGQDYKICFENANKTAIAAFQKEQDRQDKIEEERRKQELQDKLNQNGSNYGNGSGNSSSNGGFGGNNNDQGSSSEGYEGIEGTGDLFNDLANQMISIANKEASKTKNNYGDYYVDYPWCARFVMWIAKQTTVDNTNLYNNVFEKEMKIKNPESATNSIYTFHTSKSLSFYKSPNYGGNYTPKKGDLIYFDWTGNWDQKISANMHVTPRGHVGIVEYVKNGRVYTIEGNSDDSVAKLNYDLNSTSIIGYGSWYK